MKIELDTISGDQYRIESYTNDAVVINGESHTSSLIVSPARLVTGWDVAAFADLAVQHIEMITDLQPEIIILGTGRQIRFPAPHIIAGIFDRNIGFEVMDTGAACRCYNLLVSEDRRVAAGLIIPGVESLTGAIRP